MINTWNNKKNISWKFTCALSYSWYWWQTFSIIDKNNSKCSWQSAFWNKIPWRLAQNKIPWLPWPLLCSLFSRPCGNPGVVWATACCCKFAPRWWRAKQWHVGRQSVCLGRSKRAVLNYIGERRANVTNRSLWNVWYLLDVYRRNDIKWCLKSAESVISYSCE